MYLYKSFRPMWIKQEVPTRSYNWMSLNFLGVVSYSKTLMEDCEWLEPALVGILIPELGYGHFDFFENFSPMQVLEKNVIFYRITDLRARNRYPEPIVIDKFSTCRIIGIFRKIQLSVTAKRKHCGIAICILTAFVIFQFRQGVQKCAPSRYRANARHRSKTSD